MSDSIFHLGNLAEKGKREQDRSWRAQQDTAQAFPRGRQGDLCRPGIHLISRLASASRCAAVSDEYSVMSPSVSQAIVLLSQRLPCLLTYVINFVCIVVDNTLPNACQMSPCPGFISASPLSNIYCMGSKSSVLEVTQIWV